MNTPDQPKQHPEEIFLPRWVQVPVGLLLGGFTLLCLAGSALMIFGPNEKAPILAPVLGVIWVIGCFWALEKCARLILNIKNRGGLMSPRSLRAMGWLFLVLPVGGIFTGYFKSHTLIAVVQTAAYISFFFGVRSLAAHRDAVNAQPTAPADGLRPPLS